MPDVKALLAAARRPERVVPVYLVDLRDQIAEAEASLREAAGVRGDRATPSKAERDAAKQVEALREQMAEGRLDIRLRAMSRAAWRALMEDHQPRRTETGTVVEDDAIGVNSVTFFPALIRASIVDPVFDEDDMVRLLDEALSPRQFDDLADAAWGINRRGVEVPLSLAASRTLRTSGTE